MKDNKITVRFSDEELKSIKKIAKKREQKVATLIRETMLKAITNDELLSDKEELQKFIIKTIEKANDTKLGRIISLLFRATSHIDIVKEQNNILYHSISTKERTEEDFLGYAKIDHPITKVAKQKIGKRDVVNINRKRNKTFDFYEDI